MNIATQNKNVRIKMDHNLADTGLQNEYGIIIQTDGLMSKIMMMSGKEIGKTHHFLSLQFEEV